MSTTEEARAEIRASKPFQALRAAMFALRSYENHNASPELAKECADFIDATLDEMLGVKRRQPDGPLVPEREYPSEAENVAYEQGRWDERMAMALKRREQRAAYEMPVMRGVPIAPNDFRLPADDESVLADHRRLVRKLDVALFCDGAAKQASLCDLLGPAREIRDAIIQAVDTIDRGGAQSDALSNTVKRLRAAIGYDSPRAHRTSPTIAGLGDAV